MKNYVHLNDKHILTVSGCLGPFPVWTLAHFGRSWGVAVVVGKLQEPGHLTYLDNSRQGPTALAVDAGGVC